MVIISLCLKANIYGRFLVYVINVLYTCNIKVINDGHFSFKKTDSLSSQRRPY